MGNLMRYTKAMVLLALLAAMVTAAAAPFGGPAAQEVRLRRGDRLEMTVPQRSGLDRQLVVDNQGRVNIPIVGSVNVEGLLIAEAEEAVLRAMREAYPSVQNLILSLIVDDSRRAIYVHGEVVNPGKYEFVESPNIWEAVREAGGVTAEASLASVRIIRAEGEDQRTFLVNLQAVIESGDFESLPVLRPGDAVIIPQRSLMYSGGGAVRVIGAVATPGPYSMGEGQSLVDAILAAGGPSETSDLKNVSIVRRMQDGGQITIRVDFRKYLEDGDIRHNPIIYANDTIHVPRRESGFTWVRDPRFWLTAVTAFAALYAVLQ